MNWDSTNQELAANVVKTLVDTLERKKIVVIMFDEQEHEVDITIALDGLGFKIIDEPKVKLILYKTKQSEDSMEKINDIYGEWFFTDFNNIEAFCSLAISNAILKIGEYNVR